MYLKLTRVRSRWIQPPNKGLQTISSRAFGVGDSAEVYAVIFMGEEDIDLDNKIIKIYGKFSPERKQQVIDFVDFLIWREEKRKANLDLEKEDDD